MNLLRLMFLGVCITLLTSCGSSVASGGSGTGTGNPVVVAGIAYNQDGSVAPHAEVRVRGIENTARDTLRSYLGDEFDSLGVVHCDDRGAFAFTLIENGEYLLEVRDSSGEGSHVDPLFVTDDADTVMVKNILLLSLDTLRGSVSLHGAVNSDAVQIFAYGTDYYTTAANDGSYELALPRGVYDINIVPINEDFHAYILFDVNSQAYLADFKILAKNPISYDYTTDSLIVRSILNTNGLYGIRVDQVSWIDSLTGRIIELDFEPDIEDQSPINISGYLTVIPESVGGMLALEQLEIQFSNLTTIPSSIGLLPNLTILEINYNEFTELPVELANLQSLTFLDLAGNHLSTLPEPLKSWADTFDSDWATTQQ